MSSWPSSREELAIAQEELTAKTAPHWLPGTSLCIGGCWICFSKGLRGSGGAGDRAWAAAVALEGRRTVSRAHVEGKAGGAYEPGMLALREGPLLEQAVASLSRRPDVLLVNATGRDHPRATGLALHLGVVLGVPSIGVTHRTLLAEGEWPDDEPGAIAPFSVGDSIVGVWMRTRVGRRPVAVHPGWRTDVNTSVEVVRRSLKRARTPEPLRRARQLARLARAGLL